MKKFVLFFISFFVCSMASAQYNYYRISIGGGVGVTSAFADLQKKLPKPMFFGTLDYNITPFLIAGLEFQKGTLSGGDKTADTHLRYFSNSYSALILGTRVQLGQFVDFENSNLLYALRGFYIGSGVGLLNNKMTDIVRIQPGSNRVNPGVDQSKELFVPINTGVSFNILDQFNYTKFVVSANYQLNVVFGEGLDGYNDPPAQFKNNGHDFFGVLSIGLKYSFGPEGLY